MLKNSKINGFTLVELLVTIAIMLALVGIAVPSAISLMSKNKTKAHELQVDELIASSKSYVLDNKGKWNAKNMESATQSNPYCFSIDDLATENYIDEIPIDPLTDEEFKGSINIYVDNNKIKYEYSEEECSNRLVDAGLTEMINYDEYLTVDSSNGNGNYVGDAIEGIVNNTQLVTGSYSDVAFGEPGIKHYTSSTNDLYYFVGPVDNNYVKIKGLTYPEDVEYVGQAGNDILWRVISMDNKTGEIRLISDAGIFKGTLNTFDINKLQWDRTALGEMYKTKHKIISNPEYPRSSYEYDNYTDASNSIDGDNYKHYYSINELDVSLTGQYISKNTTKSVGTIISDLDPGDTAYIFDRYQLTSHTYYYFGSAYKVEYDGDTYTVSSISPKFSNNMQYADLYKKVIDWFDENAVSKNSSLFSKTWYCNSSITHQKVTMNNSLSNMPIPSPDTLKNCSYIDEFVQYESSYADNYSIDSYSDSYVGFLTIGEFMLMGGYDERVEYGGNTMFRYNYYPFWTAEANSMSYSDSVANAKSYTIGNVLKSSSITSSNPIRPVITLSSATQFNGGNGSKNNSYIVELGV